VRADPCCKLAKIDRDFSFDSYEALVIEPVRLVSASYCYSPMVPLGSLH
jgi:hypothetical protein